MVPMFTLNELLSDTTTAWSFITSHGRESNCQPYEWQRYRIVREANAARAISRS